MRNTRNEEANEDGMDVSFPVRVFRMVRDSNPICAFAFFRGQNPARPVNPVKKSIPSCLRPFVVQTPSVFIRVNPW